MLICYDHISYRFKVCLNLTADCGWGFNDTLGDFYYEYYQDDQDG